MFFPAQSGPNPANRRFSYASKVSAHQLTGLRSMLAHIVFFTLKDNSAEKRRALVDACRHYLDGHDGTEFFGVGTRTPDLQREVNDQTFDVALHVIFSSREAHDALSDSRSAPAVHRGEQGQLGASPSVRLGWLSTAEHGRPTAF